MMRVFEQLCDWLHACRPAGTTPQWGAADERKVGFWWSPGKADKPAGAGFNPARAVFLGSTNRSYRDPHAAMGSQESWVTFAALDIDWEDQTPELRKGLNLYRALLEATEEVASLRTSCGGRGFHVIFRLSEPVGLPANPGPGAHTAVTRHILRLWRRRVEAAGVHVCKDDSRMFWLCGGKNEWAHQTDQMLKVDPMLLRGAATVTALPSAPVGSVSGRVPMWVASDGFVSGWLEKIGVAPGLCYAGTVIARLRALGERVETRSPCSGNGTPNGYLDIAPGRVSLWTYADGGTIWCAEDVERTVAAMMGDGGVASDEETR